MEHAVGVESINVMTPMNAEGILDLTQSQMMRMVNIVKIETIYNKN